MDLVDTDVASEDVIPSTWRTAKATKESSFQTRIGWLAKADPTFVGASDAKEFKELVTRSVDAFQSNEAQTESYAEAETQTTPEFEEVKISNDVVQAASAALLRLAPLVEEQIRRNLSSTAFDEYTVSWDEERDSISLLHALSHRPLDSKAGTAAAAASSSKAKPESKGDRKTASAFDRGREEKKAAAVSAGASSVSGDSGAASSLSCTAVSWNSNGSMLAAAYGRSDHAGWCQHQGQAYLCFWNIMRRQLRADQADLAVELPCCINCVEFHPEKPSVVAGGLFNGEVRVWDASNGEEPQLFSSAIDDFCHREPVSRVAWVRDLRENTYQIVSISGDGKILFWSEENKLAFPKYGASLVPTKKYHGQGLVLNRHPVMGGSSLAFSSLDYSSYVVGTEGGGVLKCLQPQALLKGAVSKAKTYVKSAEFSWAQEAYRLIELCDAANKFEVKRAVERYAKLNALPHIEIEHVFAARPDAKKIYPQAVNFAFEAHAGPVYGVSFSPFHRNVFATCSTDGVVRIYNMLKPKPLLSLEPAAAGACYLLDVAWSSIRPLVLAVADAEGRVHIYDLAESMLGPVYVVAANADKSPVSCVRFNQRDPSLLASVDQAGRVCVWQLSLRLSTLQKGERALLDQMGAAS